MKTVILISIIIFLWHIVDAIYEDMQWKEYNKNRKLYYSKTGKRLKEPFTPKRIL